MKNIKTLLENYMKKNNISNRDLEYYLKPNTRNFDMFIKRNKLQGFENMVIESIKEKSSTVLRLEDFKIFEDFRFNKLSICFYKGIEPPTIEYEKVLSDTYDANLSNIDIVDKHRNLFEISDWGINKFKVVIYHDNDLDIIRKNISEYIFEKMSQMSIEVIDGFEVSLEKVISKTQLDHYINENLTKQNIIEVISDSLLFEYKGQFNEYHIWE